MSYLNGARIEVGDKGFVQLVDVMGNDFRIVDAARISYGNHNASVRNMDKDRNLIRYLMKHRHTSPFEQVELCFIVRCPMDVWRQWIRHRTANVNEYSTRYTEAVNEMATTDARSWRLQNPDNAQGSSGMLPLSLGMEFTDQEAQLQNLLRQVYEDRLGKGIAREQARKDLPLSTYTEAYWKIDLHNLLHFLGLRMDSHAQIEIREFATAIYENFVIPLFPFTAEAFNDYVLSAETFSRMEMEILRNAFDADDINFPTNMSEREMTDFRRKING